MERKKRGNQLFFFFSFDFSTYRCSALKIQLWTKPTSRNLQLNEETRPGNNQVSRLAGASLSRRQQGVKVRGSIHPRGLWGKVP